MPGMATQHQFSHSSMQQPQHGWTCSSWQMTWHAMLSAQTQAWGHLLLLLPCRLLFGPAHARHTRMNWR